MNQEFDILDIYYFKLKNTVVTQVILFKIKCHRRPGTVKNGWYHKNRGLDIGFYHRYNNIFYFIIYNKCIYVFINVVHDKNR